jgi:hypothetical protein
MKIGGKKTLSPSSRPRHGEPQVHIISCPSSGVSLKLTDWPTAGRPNSDARRSNSEATSETMSFKGQPYLVHLVLPNFYFHCTTAYNILRHCGVELGKRDFIGAI